MPLLQLQRAFKTLTNAEIKALPSTPITLIAAPGAGFRIKVLGGTLSADVSAGAYTNINATYAALWIEYPSAAAMTPLVDDVSTTPDLTNFTIVFGTAQDTVTDLSAPYLDALASFATSTPALKANVENALLRVSMDNNGSGALTGGNSANTLQVCVSYLVEPL